MEQNIEYGTYLCNAKANTASPKVMYAAAGLAFIASGYLGYLVAPYALAPKPETRFVLGMGSTLGVVALLIGIFAILAAREHAKESQSFFYELGMLHRSNGFNRFIRYESFQSLELKIISFPPMILMIIFLGLIGHQMAKYCGRIQLRLDDGTPLRFKVTRNDIERIAQASYRVCGSDKLKLINVDFE